MKAIKKAPTPLSQGHLLQTKTSYPTDSHLSRAAGIIFLALQAPKLRRACYDGLDVILRLYYGV